MCSANNIKLLIYYRSATPLKRACILLCIIKWLVNIVYKTSWMRCNANLLLDVASDEGLKRYVDATPRQRTVGGDSEYGITRCTIFLHHVQRLLWMSCQNSYWLLRRMLEADETNDEWVAWTWCFERHISSLAGGNQAKSGALTIWYSWRRLDVLFSKGGLASRTSRANSLSAQPNLRRLGKSARSHRYNSQIRLENWSSSLPNHFLVSVL